MDPEGEMAALNVKLAEEEEALQHGLPPILGADESPKVVNENEMKNVKNGDVKPDEGKAEIKETKKSKLNEDFFIIIMILVLYILQGSSMNSRIKIRGMIMICDLFIFKASRLVLLLVCR